MHSHPPEKGHDMGYEKPSITVVGSVAELTLGGGRKKKKGHNGGGGRGGVS